jgi:hypothetical protein
VGGDLWFGVKALLVDGGRQWPSLGVREMTKTTTGKGLSDRRFTNSPGYLLDILGSVPLGRHGPVEVELWGTAGFFAWQQGRNGQNDCFDWSLTLAGQLTGGSLVRVDVRGYSGWQANDEPVVVAAGVEWRVLDALAVTAGVNWGLRDAPLADAHVGLRIELPAIIPLAVGGEPAP